MYLEEFNTPNTLQIRCIQARYLKCSSLRSTVSSYVKIRCNGKKSKTSIISKNITPTWDQTFTFIATDWTCTAILKVCDKANYKMRLIGQCRIPITDFNETKSYIKWLPLFDKHWKAASDIGELQVEASWIYTERNDPVLHTRRAAEYNNNEYYFSEDDEDQQAADSRINLVLDGDVSAIEAVIVEQEEETEHERQLRAQELAQLQSSLSNISQRNKSIPAIGDYQVQVHVIEARDLKGEDLSGSSDPVVTINVMGTKKNTSVKHNTVGCVYDESFFFHFKNMSREELSSGFVQFSVFDSNKVMRNTLIGVYKMDLMYLVNETPDAEVYRTWIALMDYDSKSDNGIQGFLLVTVTLLLPGASPPVHDRDAELRQEHNRNSTDAESSMVLLPPSLSSTLEFIVIDVYKAENLPSMDNASIVSSAGIDAFVQVDFGGNPACKTSVVTVKGETDLSVLFYESLWLPILTPTMASRITLSVWDWDRGIANNDLVSQSILDLKSLDDVKKKWVNLYGPAPGSTSSKVAEKIIKTYPYLCSVYNGRLLISARRVSNFDASSTLQVPHVVDLEDDSISPATLRYTLRGVLSRGIGLSSDTSVIRVSIGNSKLTFSELNNSPDDRYCIWNESKEKRGIILPADFSQIPDIIIHVLSRDCKKILAFTRVSAAFVLTNAAKEKWYKLQSIAGSNNNSSSSCQVLLKLGFGREEVMAKNPWVHDYDAVHAVKSMCVRVHLFQLQHLSTSSSSNITTVKINVNGVEKNSKKVRGSDSKILLYETIVFNNLELPVVSTKPPIIFSVKSSVGVLDFDLVSNASQVPQPQWIDLTRSANGPSSSSSIVVSHKVLVSAQVFPMTDNNIPPMVSIKPATRKAWIEIMALGIRNLKSPHAFVCVQNPSVKFKLLNGSSASSVSTMPSCRPNGSNANFLTRLVLPVSLPCDPCLVPQLRISVLDHLKNVGRRLASSHVASCVIDLQVPWGDNSSIIPPVQSTFDETKQDDEDDRSVNNNQEDESLHDDGIGIIGIELRPIKKEDENDDPAVAEQKKFEKARRYYAACADARKKGSFVKMEDLDTKKEEQHKQEVEPPAAYFTGRDWWIKQNGLELEKYLKTTPFESYRLYKDSSSRVDVGTFKGIIRVLDNDPEKISKPPSSSVFIESEPQPFTIRLYVLKAVGLQPKDFNGSSDPYLKVSLGSSVASLRKSHLTKTLNPDFFNVFTFDTTLPGPSQLVITVMDYDRIGFRDDVIGTTVIDLEDRWFNKRWQEIGNGHPSLGNNCGMLKPIEYRSLWNQTCSKTSQGTIQCWVDILPPNIARIHPAIDITPPPPRKFEVRVIIWKSEDIVDRDASEMNDLFVTTWLEGHKPQSTDVHWRCSTGRAMWNYRMKFPVTLPLRAPEFGRLHVQCWDKDIVKWNDVIGETQIDLYKWFQKAYRTNEIVSPFKELKQQQSFAEEECEEENEEPVPEVSTLEEELSEYDSSDATSEDLESGAGGGQRLEKKPLLNTTRPRFFKYKKTKQPDVKSKRKLKEKNEAKEAVATFMDMIGMGRLQDDADWVTMYYTDREAGSSEKMGKIAISLSIVPEKEAEGMPVGTGREDPNVNPFLPPPVGRMKVSSNPLRLLKEVVGPKTCAKLVCVFCCVFCMGFVALFGAGVMSTLTFINQQTATNAVPPPKSD